MKTYLDCLPCFVSQALREGRVSTKDEEKIKKLIDKVGCMLSDIPMESTPPETGDVIYREIRKITGVSNPYKEIKKRDITEALSLYPKLKEIVKSSNNSLLTAVRIAVAGNVIDIGINKKYNILSEIDKVLEQEFAILHFDDFASHLKMTKSILYIGDNAGESVFDKILIEEMGKPVTYVVRDIPVLNDATIEDAIDSGLDEVAEIISSGCSAPGTILKLCNPDFLERLKNANMVISKGQGNYEGLSNVNHPVFFLLKAKCSVIADDLNVKENDIVLKAINMKNR